MEDGKDRISAFAVSGGDGADSIRAYVAYGGDGGVLISACQIAEPSIFDIDLEILFQLLHRLGGIHYSLHGRRQGNDLLYDSIGRLTTTLEVKVTTLL